MSDDYETDILAWSERQAGLLARIAAGQSSNESPDWPNIVEEIESVGRSQLQAVRSLLIQSLLHTLNSEAWPLSRDATHWRAEARRFRIDAADAFSPSMRQRIDVRDLYAKALRSMPETIDGREPVPVPQTCGVTLDHLLQEP